MGLFQNLFSGGDSVRGIVDAATELPGKIRDAVTGEEHKLALEEFASQARAAQVELNKAEIVSGKIFAMWRPFLGWVLGVSLAMFFLPQYAAAAVLWVREVVAAGELVPYPVNADGLIELVLGMLGLAGLRTYEKVKDVQGKH